MFHRDFLPGPSSLEQLQDHLVDGVASEVTGRDKSSLTGLIPMFRVQMDKLTTEATALVPGRTEVEGLGLPSPRRSCHNSKVCRKTLSCSVPYPPCLVPFRQAVTETLLGAGIPGMGP